VPTLRLRADYLAIVTIAAAEIIRYFLASARFTWLTGGSNGKNGWTQFFSDVNPLVDSDRFNLWEQPIDGYRLFMLLLGWGLVALLATLVWLLMRSPWGRVLKGIREDEDAVRSLGKNVFAYKMQALIIGGIFGALGGVVFALPSAVIPATYTTSLTFFLWTILLLGGAATVFGPAVGSVIFWVIMAFLDNVLPALASEGILPMTPIQAGILRFILVGVALMLIVIFRPQGIFGNKRELTFVK